MSQENPKVQVKTNTPFGVSYHSLDTDHNQIFNSLEDWRYSLAKRLAFSPRLEVAFADALLWVSVAAIATKTGIYATALGVPVAAISWLALIGLIPVLYWALWVTRHLEDTFREITGLRLSLVLLGVATAIIF